jgi:glycosyltransferase involved in cell wall biosynthesis
LRLSVLHVLPASPFGGAQRLAIDLAAEQRAAGWDSRILFTDGGGASRTAAALKDVPSVCGATEMNARIARIWATRAAVSRAAPEILHLHMPPPWINLALSSRGRLRVVTHLHARPPLQVHAPALSTLLGHYALKRILAASNLTVAVSEWVAAAHRAAYPTVRTPCRIVYNGVDLPAGRRARPPAAGPPVIGTAARVAPRKGLDEFIDFAAALHARRPEFRFLIAGEGEPDYRRHLVNRIRERGLERIVSFAGFVSPIDGFWADMDLAAFTSPFEPFGLRLIEPVAFGVPAIGYLTGTGSDEIIARCRGIEAVPYGDADALADLAADLIAAPERRAAMAEQGRADVTALFSVDVMSRNVAAAYERLLGRSIQGTAP